MPGVLEKVPHHTGHRLHLLGLVLLLAQKLRKLQQRHCAIVPRIFGKVGRKHVGRKHQVLEHGAKVVEKYLARVFGVVLVELVFERRGGDLEVDFLHAFFELLKGDDTLLARGLHLVEGLSEPPLEAKAVAGRRNVLKQKGVT